VSPLLTPGEAAALAHVAPITIYRAVRSGRLPSIRIGSRIRIARRDFNTWLEATSKSATVRPRRRRRKSLSHRVHGGAEQ